MAARVESRERRLGLVFGFQVLALFVVAFVPFGFDHPSRFGLDFEHFLGLAALYLVAWIWGVALSVSLRRRWLLVGQIVLPASFAALALTGVLGV